MGRIPDHTIQAIRDRIDLVDLVSRYVSLRRAGSGYLGLCPFHREKTPSFHVHPERQIFHCFGCGVGGNAFGFLMRIEAVSFPEAVRALAREVGIEVPEEGGGGRGALGERLAAANEVAQRLYRATLEGSEGAAARRYLAKRGIGRAEAERFGIGLAPRRWGALAEALHRAGIGTELALQAGLLASGRSGRPYDRLRGRITFPIRDARGRLLGFGGRALDPGQEPKYLNTPETPIFRKRECFYGLAEALPALRRRGRAVIVEGYFDRIALHRAGVEEAIATCGTALSEDHARSLRRRVREVVLLFDADEGGRRAMERALGVLVPEGLRVRAAALPPGEDPASFLLSAGAEALAERVELAPPAFDVLLRERVAAETATPWEKADAVAAVARLVARIPDPVERGEVARRLAHRARVREAEVEEAVRRARQAGPHASESALAPAAPACARGGTDPRMRFGRRIAEVLLAHPSLAEEAEASELARLFDLPPWERLLPELVRSARAARAAGRERIDVAELAERLEGEAAAKLTELAARELPPWSLDEARRVFRDTVARVAARRDAERSRALTRQLAEDPSVDWRALLEAKQRELERRRAARGVAPSPVAPGRP